MPANNNPTQYRDCLPEATKRFNSGSIKTCPRGYCTAKNKFKVYPSAYANGYASSVCQGKQPDMVGKTKENAKYMERINNLESGKTQQNSNMGRWFKENWVNICEPKINGEYQPCGRHNADLNPNTYPYCRPEIRIDDGTPMTVGEIIDKHGKSEIKKLCKLKRSKPQGEGGLPYYLRTEATIHNRTSRKTYSREEIKSAINGKTFRNGGLNLDGLRQAIIINIIDKLDNNTLSKIGRGLKISQNPSKVKTRLIQDVQEDTRKQIEELGKILLTAITKSSDNDRDKDKDKDKDKKLVAACQGEKPSNGGLKIKQLRKKLIDEITDNSTLKNRTYLPSISEIKKMDIKGLMSLCKSIGIIDNPQRGGETTDPNMKLVDRYNKLDICHVNKNNLYKVTNSDKGKKKLKVNVLNKQGNLNTIHFGHRDYQDYTRHRDKGRRENYCKRSGGIKCTKNPDNICDQTSANFWSRTALWDCDMSHEELCKSISDSSCKSKLKC